jgi:MYXO-CTERM domain-containing protein
MRAGILVATALFLSSLPANADEPGASAETAAVRAAHHIARMQAIRAGESKPLASRCHTQIAVEAFQDLPNLPDQQRSELQALLGPPVDLQFSVESTTPFPVRVSFADPTLQVKAERVLQAIATSYTKEVTEWGFWTPPVEPGTEPYRFYLMGADGAAGYTVPYLENPATPHADAFTYIVIESSLDDLQIDSTVAHELSHATQIAMDAREQPSFMENTSSYIEIPVFPESTLAAASMFPFFQGQPWRPIEYKVAGMTDGYEYGAGLWLLFLTHYYASEDPVLIREIWEGTVQNGVVNEPDYFDAIDGLVEGGVADVAHRLSEYRFFVGDFDDGAHLPNAWQWSGAEVWTTASWFDAQLPVEDQKPVDPSTRPQPNGCNYIVFSPSKDALYPVRFSFDGDASFPWSVQLFQLARGASATMDVPIDADAHGAVVVETNDLDRVVLAVCQAMSADYDPDDKAWLGGDYRYSIEYDTPPPQIVSVTPPAIAAGSHDVAVTVEGAGFVDHPSLEVALGGQLAVDILAVSDDAIDLAVTVAPNAALGPRDVTVTNPGGASATATGALSIVAADAASGVEPPSSDAGCACSSSADRQPRWSAAWLLAALLFAARRRPRALGAVVAAALVGFAGVASAGPPPPSDGFVESSTYPLRIHYTNSAGPAVAQQALASAEAAWQLQVVEMGFPAPVTEDENGNRIPGLWFYLDPDAGGDYPLAIGDNPDTPQSDCTMRAVIKSIGDSGYLDTVIAHEMNHALQMTADCGESPFGWENTSIAINVLSKPEDPLFAAYFLPTFQQFPYNGVDCLFWANQEKSRFHYGAALFSLFLEDRYAGFDGKLLASFWNAAMQDGSVVSVSLSGSVLDVPNDPNLIDAMRVVLGDVTFEEAVTEFARWRWFVGGRDDGQHFTLGASWTGSEVAIDTALGLDQLPVMQGTPVNLLNDYGSAFVELTLRGADAEHGVTFDFGGDPSVGWSADVLLLKSDRTADVKTMELVDGQGTLLLDGLTDYQSAVLVVTNLGNEAHDPDTVNCNGGVGFTYSLQVSDLAKPPVLDSVDPNQLGRGQSHYVWLYGTDLADGSTVDMGQGVHVGGIDFIDATTIGVELSVDADAAPGPRDVTVTSPGGLSATMAGGVSIVDASATDDAASCGCVLPGSDRGGSRALLVLVLGLAAFARRRRL